MTAIIFLGNGSRRVDNFKNVIVEKELKVECAELVQGICLDVLAIKLKDPSKYYKLLKRCDILIKEVENNMKIGMTERLLKMVKLLHKMKWY